MSYRDELYNFIWRKTSAGKPRGIKRLRAYREWRLLIEEAK